MKVWLSWSSGKDSAFTLHRLHQQGIKVDALFTTVNEQADRVCMHAVRKSLLQAQADALSLPLHCIAIPFPCTNLIYEQRMHTFVEMALSHQVTHFAFGDIFLEEVKRYREKALAETGVEPLFPLWGESSISLAHEMIASGIRAVTTCIDPKQIASHHVGRHYDAAFLEQLPESADPCGEQGEFHTFVYDAPLFSKPIAISLGDYLRRDGFVYADVNSP